MSADIAGKSNSKYADPRLRKAGDVKGMFARVARLYDPVNRAMCFGLDSLWRKRLAERALALSGRRGRGAIFADLACGSGGVSVEILSADPSTEVVCVDFCPEMLEAAKMKIKKSPYFARAKFEAADCENLPFDGGSFDGATLAFGFRNFENRQKCLREIFRVLKPGAAVAMLEVSRCAAYLRPFQRFFMCTFVPAVARVLGANPRDYAYLGKTSMDYPPKRVVESMFASAGFRCVRTESMGFGMVAITCAKKPSGGEP